MTIYQSKPRIHTSEWAQRTQPRTLDYGVQGLTTEETVKSESYPSYVSIFKAMQASLYQVGFNVEIKYRAKRRLYSSFSLLKLSSKLCIIILLRQALVSQASVVREFN